MKKQILWPERRGELLSPFMKGENERRLRITFHSQSLNDLSDEEAKALEALDEMACLTDIEALRTGDGVDGTIEIGQYDKALEYIPVLAKFKNGAIKGSNIYIGGSWPGITNHFLQGLDPEEARAKIIIQDILVAMAHHSLDQDLLITLSPNLLGERTETLVRRVNSCKPSEAIQISGLYLRSRGNFIYSAGGNITHKMNRGAFYLVLTRHRLPNMWRYFSGCVEASKVLGDDILNLGQSIMVRCMRALEARDAIGEQFYLPQNNDTRDAILYHFDYLTLLLSGVFDALARVAYRVYQIQKPTDEKYASFRRKEFTDSLRNCPAQDLYNLVTSQHFEDVANMVSGLRNTIHGASLTAFGYSSSTNSDGSYIKVENSVRPKIEIPALRCGGLEQWGIKREFGWFYFEPYTFSCKLVAESINLADEIASKTEVERLFPSGFALPQLMTGPPEDGLFNESIRERLNIMA